MLRLPLARADQILDQLRRVVFERAAVLREFLGVMRCSGRVGAVAYAYQRTASVRFLNLCAKPKSASLTQPGDSTFVSLSEDSTGRCATEACRGVISGRLARDGAGGAV